MSEEKQYSLDKPDDDYTECILDPNNDRREIICDSQNKSDSIIQCIGSIESQYIPDANTEQTEKTHGTGTVIHIDNQNNIYILTAAHNILIMQKECKQCKTKTLKTYCPNNKCQSRYKTKKTSNLIKPTHIYFSRRGHGIMHTLGQNIERYQIEQYKLPNEYYKFPTPRGGYDIAILTVKCNDKNGIDLYKENCTKISLINDETFGGKKNILNIYGFPGEKRKEENHRVYYYLFGMSSSKLDKTNKFEVTKHEYTNKLYIVNKGIDTTSGQSGSCIYSYCDNDRNKFLIYGIHCGGSQTKRANWGTFLDIDNVEWIANVLGKNIYLDNLMLNKFRISEYGLTLSQSEKEKDFETKFWREKQRTQQLELEIKKLKNLIDQNGNKHEEIKENENDIQQNVETDYFDVNLVAKEMNISNNNKTIDNKNVGWFGGVNTCYGTKVVPSMLKNKTYIWKFRNLHTKTWGLFIGIDNAEGKWVNSNFSLQKEKASYAYGPYGGGIFEWNQKNKTVPHTLKKKGDILTMKLTFNESCGQLSFKVNNGPEFIATNNVAQDNALKYRMAIQSNSSSTIGIELVDFKEI